MEREVEMAESLLTRIRNHLEEPETTAGRLDALEKTVGEIDQDFFVKTTCSGCTAVATRDQMIETKDATIAAQKDHIARLEKTGSVLCSHCHIVDEAEEYRNTITRIQKVLKEAKG